MVICLERGADLHMAQLMSLPLTVSCFSKIQIGFTFLVPAHPGSPGKRAVKRVCVCMTSSVKPEVHNVSRRRRRTTEPQSQKIGKDQTCSSGDMLAHRQTHTHTHTQTRSSQYSAAPTGGGVINKQFVTY